MIIGIIFEETLYSPTKLLLEFTWVSHSHFLALYSSTVIFCSSQTLPERISLCGSLRIFSKVFFRSCWNPLNFRFPPKTNRTLLSIILYQSDCSWEFWKRCKTYHTHFWSTLFSNYIFWRISKKNPNQIKQNLTSSASSPKGVPVPFTSPIAVVHSGLPTNWSGW